MTEQIIYHVGSLAFDRRLSNEVEEAARAAYADYKRGDVHLVQRRINGARYEYISIKKARRGNGTERRMHTGSFLYVQRTRASFAHRL